jgi:hypothetical protein
MQLADGLSRFQIHPSYPALTVPLESAAQDVLILLQQHGDHPSPDALSEVKRFLIDVEKWKADCLQQRMGNAVQNGEKVIWGAFRGALKASSDIERLLSIMELKGFGSSVDDETGQRRAKIATSVLRFLWPDQWGVVDWRVAAMRSLLDKHNWNVDAALSESKKHKAQELRNSFDLLDERSACEMNQRYREISRKHPDSLPRAADVDMALFGLSLVAWPMKT